MSHNLLSFSISLRFTLRKNVPLAVLVLLRLARLSCTRGLIRRLFLLSVDLVDTLYPVHDEMNVLRRMLYSEYIFSCSYPWM
jgi:hypothetical protein